MKRSLAVLLFAFAFVSFRPIGSGTAHLTCKSESGRTVFKAELKDITGLLEKAELVVDDKKLSFDSQDEVYTIFDAEKKVFTVYITGESTNEYQNGRFIEFWALPETFKIIKSDRADQRYEFKARIEGTEPRKGKALRIPRVELNCVLVYKI
jgi:hypothetical protein